MMRQYNEIKQQAPDAVLFFRLGDFYEMFGQDALEASEILGIVLTARNKGDNRMPMCGVPYHAAASYIAKLTRVGKKVAICEQLSDPALPGIVKREIIRIITPGTTLDENVLDERTSNFLAAIAVGDGGIGLALVEISTGEFNSDFVQDETALLAEFQKYKPKEIIYAPDGLTAERVEKLRRQYAGAFWHEEKPDQDWENKLEAHFGTFTVSNQELKQAERLAAGLALTFLVATQKTAVGENSLKHLKTLSRPPEKRLVLDEVTIRNLEILENLREKKAEGSLLGVLDKTVTSSGGRMIKKILVEPLSDLSAIEQRLGMIDLLMRKQNLILDLRLVLKSVMDIERILGRLNLGSGNGRDLRGLVASFRALGQLKTVLEKDCGEIFNVISRKINLLPDLIGELDRAVVEEAPFSIKEGGIIAPQYDSELDALRNLSSEGKAFIQALQMREIARTGINSLKVRYNRVFGYYIEVSNTNLAQVPSDYTRKQTLANAERFTTPELKEYEEKVLTAEEKIVQIEQRIFEKLRQMALDKTLEIKESAAAAAYLDVLVSLALAGWENRYRRPQISEGFDLKISGGRHPVIEKLNSQDKFIANDTFLTDEQRLLLITGPNMGGKSTFLRQTALIVLMAHLGMYVPAESAEIPLVDRIFTRVGASDNLVKGQSTFWLEMEETATILAQAGPRSLIILDEIGRGTSTFDGVSIAWGVMEFIHDRLKAKTLFASHYHELIKLADTLPHAANFSVKIEETPDNGLVFLYKVGPGGVDRSYGIEVARLAGLPQAVIARAKEILADLEQEQIGTGQQSFGFLPSATADRSSEPGGRTGDLGRRDYQTDEKTERSHAGLEKLRNLDLNQLTPLEALNKLNELKKNLDT
jgi:DNA mismatch repair protein MutS